MRKVIAAIGITAIADGLHMPLYAQPIWVSVHETEIKSSVFYAPSTIRRDGEKARVWVMVNLPYKQPDGSLSFREYWEMNCKEVSYKILQHENYPERQLSGGRISGETDAGDWRFIAPNTVDKMIWNKVCSG